MTKMKSSHTYQQVVDHNRDSTLPAWLIRGNMTQRLLGTEQRARARLWKFFYCQVFDILPCCNSSMLLCRSRWILHNDIENFCIVGVSLYFFFDITLFFVSRENTPCWMLFALASIGCWRWELERKSEDGRTIKNTHGFHTHRKKYEKKRISKEIYTFKLFFNESKVSTFWYFSRN